MGRLVQNRGGAYRDRPVWEVTMRDRSSGFSFHGCSFCFCDDLIDVIMMFMNKEPESGDPEDAFVGPVNIGNPTEFTIKELAEKVVALTGSRSSFRFLPLPKDDPLQRKPDISLAKRELGWEPKVQLEEGLRRTIAYFREVDLNDFRRPTQHTAHKSSERSKQ